MKPNEHHLCGFCGAETQTLHGRLCVQCQKRVTEQIKRNLRMAQLFDLEIISHFTNYEKE